jgi:hypothetical protein
MAICFLIAILCLAESVFWHMMAPLPGLYELPWGKASGLLLLAELSSLVLFFKWPWILGSLVALRLLLSSLRFFPWDGTGLNAFAKQHLYTIILFLTAAIGVVISRLNKRKVSYSVPSSH